jgi:S-DNA-T family DNA segregation ATPase FtsK/SpoIIIE
MTLKKSVWSGTHMSKRDEKEEPEEKEEKREKASSRSKKSSPLGHELWGVVFLSIGLLVLISLVWHFISRTENILGPYLGTAMSAGLMFLLGRVGALLVPAALLIVGWKNLTGSGVKSSTLLFFSAFIFEISLLFAIHNMPDLAARTFVINGNYFGNMLAYSLTFPFGPHRFGPFFICTVSIIITGLLCFRINPVTAGTALVDFIVKAWQRLLAAFGKKHAAESLKNGVKKGKQTADAKSSDLDQDETEAPQDGSDPLEQERLLQQEKDLAAFRAKRNKPIRITTMGISQDDEGSAGAQDGDVIDEEEQYALSGKKAPPVKKVIGPQAPYVLPSPDILSDPPASSLEIDKDAITQNSQILEKTLLNFDIEGKVFNVCSGPVVTRYEIELAPGVKVSKVINLQNDIAMAVGGQKIRIEAPIPGKAAIGIELPNKEPQIVHFKHILVSETFRKSKAKLPMIIGQNISGMPYVTDITKMPHLLVAGQTGSGKSVCINAILCSLLMTKTPEELRLIMVDPKKVELSSYEGIPHLKSPVVSEPREAVKALYWAVMEIQRRFALLKKLRARDIDSANARLLSKDYEEGSLAEDESKPLPYIVIFVDELADLMLTASKDVESHIQRIAQLGRAAGIHLVVATQRPSVDIITGPIKANLGSRIAFRTIQATDSRTILGNAGSEKLLGKGDMLFLRNGAPDVERFHGAFIPETDVEKIVAKINEQKYEVEKFENFSDQVGDSSAGPDGYSTDGGRDEFFEEAARMIVSMGQGSTSLLQRRMKIGYSRAGRIMDELHQAGIVGPQEGSKMREVRMKPDELELFLQQLKSGTPAPQATAE